MRKITYRSRGMSIKITDDPYSAFFADFNSFKPNIKSGIFDTERVYSQNGITTYNANVSELRPRLEFTLQASMLGNQDNPVHVVTDKMRTYIAEVINPLHEGVILYEGYGDPVTLTVRPTGAPAESNFNILTGTIEYAVDFYSDSHVWQSERLFKASAGTVAGGYTYPYTHPYTYGLFGADMAVISASKGIVYPVLTFNSNNGHVSITNHTTGKTLSIDKSIDDAQQLIVDTKPFDMTAFLYEINGSELVLVDNAIYWLSSSSSDDFYLAPGINELTVNSAGSGSLPACVMEWRNSYEAV